MNITLKQNELEAAVRQYVAGQGISVVGKQLSSVKFSATRNPSGFIAELVLEDINLKSTTAVEIPGYTDRPAADATLTLAVSNVTGAVEGTTTVNTAADIPTTTQQTTEVAPAADLAVNTTDVAVASAEAGDKTVPGDAAEAEKTVAETPAVDAAPAADDKAATSTTSLFG